MLTELAQVEKRGGRLRNCAALRGYLQREARERLKEGKLLDPSHAVRKEVRGSSDFAD